MAGQISQFLSRDHRRLEDLLNQADADAEHIDAACYAQFRAGLLKHIAMEEKILLPAAQRLRGGIPLPVAEKLRLDHGALAALLVPTPTPAIIKTSASFSRLITLSRKVPRESTRSANNCSGLRPRRFLLSCSWLRKSRWRPIMTVHLSWKPRTAL
jgi:hypothetical protein